MHKNDSNSTAMKKIEPAPISPKTVEFFDKYKRSPNDMCIVLEKYQVTPMLFHLVGTRLEDIRCNLVTGETYRPQELIGDEWWVPFDGAWKREIELCLKHFAMRPDFELRDTERGTFEYVG